MSDSVDFNLGPWPTDPSKQSLYITQLLNKFVQLSTYVDSVSSDIILLEQMSEPTQEQWEMAWLAQTGKTMPVSKGASFYWWDNVNNVLAGIYGVLLDSTDILRKDPKYVRSGIVIRETDIITDIVSAVDYEIGTNLSDHPSLTFTNNQVINLEMVYSLGLVYDSGTGLIGGDFLLDGVKQGTLLYGVSADEGVASFASDGTWEAFINVPNVQPGTHVVQAIAGTAASDPTPPFVDYMARSLRVKGYSL